MARIVLRERVYLDADGRATTDPEKGVVLWGTPGMEVSEEDAAEIGYTAEGEKAKPRPERTKAKGAPEGDK
jgi:hypothetical protein